ncbi:MAG: hypothetical protein JXD18_13105 [Anaerolineae bacterium]|nr:hypothetical protein [Anaerolineae bacterium]
MQKRYIGQLLLIVLIGIGLAMPVLGGEREPDTGGGRAISPIDTGLLVNGGMEDLGFYWMPPNHFVAERWYRWWLRDDIPEYDDVRDWRPQRYDGDHAQIYFRYGATYTAGIYQRVANLQPCAFYQFQMYGRNHSGTGAEHNARIGLDPFGRTYNTLDNPRLTAVPSDIVWSPRKTYYETWGLHTVTAETRGNALTAITYVSPEPGYGYYDTFWDAGSLFQVSPPGNRFADPSSWTPSGFISNVNVSTNGDQVQITWDTSAAASTQVWYNILPVTTVSVTTPLSYTYYLPLVARSIDFDYETPVSYAPVSTHQVVIDGIGADEVVEFVAVSRRLVGDTCYTEVSAVEYSGDPWP